MHEHSNFKLLIEILTLLLEVVDVLVRYDEISFLLPVVLVKLADFATHQNDFTI